jgi:hypothetical protein
MAFPIPIIFPSFRYPSRLRAGRNRTSFVSSSLCFASPIVSTLFQSSCTGHFRRLFCLFYCTCTSFVSSDLIRTFVAVSPLLDAYKHFLLLSTRLIPRHLRADCSSPRLLPSFAPFIPSFHSLHRLPMPLGSFELLTPAILLRVSSILPTHRRATSYLFIVALALRFVPRSVLPPSLLFFAFFLLLQHLSLAIFSSSSSTSLSSPLATLSFYIFSLPF